IPRPLNQFEMEPLLEDLSPRHGDKRVRRKMIVAYVAAWSRLQHEVPGHAISEADRAFSHDLVEWLKLHEAILIGEVIPQLYQYLRSNPAAPEREEFRHILVDEYQDLNRAEQEVLAMLGENSAICIIGDDDQSIYSFKHAHPAGVREWARIHAAEDHEIAECRRCPVTVVRIANSLISHNRDRIARVLQERVGNGLGEVAIRQYRTSAEEADAVAAKIVALVTAGVPPGEIIVLAQRAVLGTPIFMRLKAADVPVKSYYAESELDTKAAQERFAIMKLLLDREDRVALRWLLGCEHPKWHSAPYARILEHIRATGDSPWNVLSGLQTGTLSIPHTAAIVGRFRDICAELAKLEAATDLDGFLNAWLPADVETKMLADLVTRCKEECETVRELFDRLYAAISQPEVPMEVAEVRVMSLHKSKGLSSPYVFIVGCVEGLIPSQPEQGVPLAAASAMLEEDRRLLYVGMTRVKADVDNGRVGYLAITYAQTMPVADALGSQITPVRQRHHIAYLQPSRFMGEFGPAAPRSRVDVPL
ncbi:MAG: ATP-dependent helicase, partial [Fimbriimonadaceae bacterium]